MKLFIYGSGGHSLVVKDIAKRCGYEEIEIIDNLSEKYKSIEEIKDKTDIPFFVAIGNNKTRKEIFDRLRDNGFRLVNLIDPSSIVSPTVTICEGVLIMPNVIVNSKAKLEKGVILNTSCLIEHECTIRAFVHISPNVALAGNVEIKKNTHIGIGSSCIQGLTIGSNCIIGAGSVVIKDIPNNVKAFGNPCKIMEELYVE